MPRPAGTMEELERTLTQVYKRSWITERVEVLIAQPRQGRRRAQFLCLVIHDVGTGRFVALKLSTFRKIVKWVTKRGFMEARRLFSWEKLMMDLHDWLHRKQHGR